ncbi:MAG: glycine--tRNA ligase subunit beta, partial [Thermoanaerobaculia bacterium]|nr:glycine--tRNA ligase subunit beta [Thermoanaerobaculia bacterium]
MNESPLLLVELLAEEIPAWMLEERLAILRSRLEELFGEYEGGPMDAARIHCDATSRRIWFSVEGLESKQPDREEEIKGPPESVALEDGEPTKAFEGFLRKNQASAEDVEIRDGYLWLQRRVEGLSLSRFVADRLPSIIEEIRWPKMMRWGTGDEAFIRPIHSVVAFYGAEMIDLEIFEIRSSSITSGHRTRGDQVVEIESAETWEATLQGQTIVPRVVDRVTKLKSTAQKLA